MAATAITLNQLSSVSPSVASQSSFAPTACDATNGNTVPNDGTVRLIFTATATDTVNVNFPGRANVDPVPIVSGHVTIVGPFEEDEFGPNLVFKAGLVTTLVVAVSIPPLA